MNIMDNDGLLCLYKSFMNNYLISKLFEVLIN